MGALMSEVGRTQRRDRQCPLSAAEQKLTSVIDGFQFCPECMDRLPFASEVVRSEVADMYPAC